MSKYKNQANTAHPLQWVITNWKWILELFTLAIAVVGIGISSCTLQEMRNARLESYKPDLELIGGNLFLYAGEFVHSLDEYPIEWSKTKYNSPEITIEPKNKSMTATKYKGLLTVGVAKPNYNYISDLYRIEQTVLNIDGENIGFGIAKEVCVEWKIDISTLRNKIKNKHSIDTNTHFWKLNGTIFEFLLSTDNGFYSSQIDNIRPNSKYSISVPNNILVLYSLYLHLLSKSNDINDILSLYKTPLTINVTQKYKDIGGKAHKTEFIIKLLLRINSTAFRKSQEPYGEIFTGIAEGRYEVSKKAK